MPLLFCGHSKMVEDRFCARLAVRAPREGGGGKPPQTLQETVRFQCGFSVVSVLVSVFLSRMRRQPL